MRQITVRASWAIPLLLSGCLLGAIVAVLVLGNRVDSLDPDAGESADADPSASLVFVQVEERVVSDEIRFRVNVFVEEEEQSLPAGLSGVVTDVFVSQDTAIEPLRPILEINGRPLFVVVTPFGFYRDIRSGDTGPDVEALQALLNSAGHELTVDGDFGPKTQAALASWYSDHGYDAPTGSADDRDVRAARDQVDLAQRAVDEAKRTKTELTAEQTRLKAADPPETERLAEVEAALRAADPAIKDAQRALRSARETLADTLGESRAILRQSEFWALGEPPRPLTSVSVEVGTELDPGGQPLGTRRPDQLKLLGSVASSDSLLLQIGQTVEVSDNVAEQTHSATITDLQYSEGTSSTVTLAMPVGSELSADRSYGVRTIEAEESVPSTAVPVTAVGQGPDGEFFVILETDDGAVQVPVTTGASARGWVVVDDPTGQVVPGRRVAAGIGSESEESGDEDS